MRAPRWAYWASFWLTLKTMTSTTKKAEVDQHQPGEIEQAPQAANSHQTFEIDIGRVIALLMGCRGPLLTSCGPTAISGKGLASRRSEYGCSLKNVQTFV